MVDISWARVDVDGFGLIERSAPESISRVVIRSCSTRLATAATERVHLYMMHGSCGTWTLQGECLKVFP